MEEMKDRIGSVLIRMPSDDITMGQFRKLQDDIFRSMVVCFGKELDRLDRAGPPSKSGETM